MTHGVTSEHPKRYIIVRIVWDDGEEQTFGDKIVDCCVVYSPDPPGSSYVCMKVDRDGPNRFDHIYRKPRSVWIIPRYV